MKAYIVGAGPGDPKQLTLRALEVIRAAETVVYDGLVSKEVLRLLPKHSKKIFVGRPHAQRPRLPQSEVNEILVTEARRGRKVVRLKGGDPFIFGRGGEEAEALVKAGIDFEVVPGLTSATAAPAYAGIPLTDRRHSSSVAILTGHEIESKDAPRVDLRKIASSVDTLVVLMGVSTLGRTARELVRGGLGVDTPLAAIEWATTGRQVTRLFTLGEVAEGKGDAVKPPSVIVIGRTAALAYTLDWFREGKLRVSPRFMAVWQKEGR